jgi:hypothetical protein
MNITNAASNRYFYLLENLAYVKSFNMCLDLEDCNEIFIALFTLMFKIVNDEHSGKVKPKAHLQQLGHQASGGSSVVEQSDIFTKR